MVVCVGHTGGRRADAVLAAHMDGILRTMGIRRGTVGDCADDRRMFGVLGDEARTVELSGMAYAARHAVVFALYQLCVFARHGRDAVVCIFVDCGRGGGRGAQSADETEKQRKGITEWRRICF